jgi:hypothetical protein
MARQKFRKIYLVVEDKSVFSKYNYDMIKMYRKKSTADQMCSINQQKAIDEVGKVYMANVPIPQFKVHGFYLVHESYFTDDEL